LVPRSGRIPFPLLVRKLQAVIGQEALEQFRERTGKLPDRVVACVGGGSNAIGMFHAFVPHAQVALVGVEAAGDGSPGCYHSATLSTGTTGVLHGTMTKLLQTVEGQILPSHSLAPGLDYPGVGPEHAHLQSEGRAEYVCVTDDQALAAFMRLTRAEGILPALESSHAMAYVLGLSGTLPASTDVWSASPAEATRIWKSCAMLWPESNRKPAMRS
jgi:tryptophan synthase beta chain